MSAACPTRKRRYADERTAKLALVETRAAGVLRRKDKRRESRAYECSRCDGWHLTSKPLNGGPP